MDFTLTDEEGSVKVKNESEEKVDDETLVIVYGYFIEKGVDTDSDHILNISKIDKVCSTFKKEAFLIEELLITKVIDVN